MKQISRSLTFLIALTIATNSFAQDAVVVEKNMPAPFTGILMTSDMANDLRKAVIERDAIKVQNDSLNKIISLQDDNFLHQQNKVGILLQQNDSLAERLQSSQSMNTWEKFGLVGLGIAAALDGAYGFKQVTR